MRRDKYCSLISFSPKDSHATYFDSGSAKKKNYENIKKVLDDALTGYALAGGTFDKKKVIHGKHVFTHVTEFPYVKQPSGSHKDAYYALHHMRAFERDQENLTLPSQLRPWASRLALIQDGDLKEAFFRIQQQFAEIIFHDVCKKGGSSTAAINRLTVR